MRLRRSQSAATAGFATVVGIPVQVLGLARLSVAGGAPLHLKTVLLSTDHCSPVVATAIEAAWGCRVFDHYGTTEMGLGGGVDCEAHAGYHLREADLLVEVVDPESGAPLPDGEYGEVVFTTLTREAMPLIRYRTGDRGRFLPGACPCGSRCGGWSGCGRGGRARQAARLAGTLARPTWTTRCSRCPAVRGLPGESPARRGRATGCRSSSRAGRGEGGALQRAALAALAAVPGPRAALRSRLARAEVTVTTEQWPAGDGTGKRTLVLS